MIEDLFLVEFCGTIFGILDMILILWIYKIYTESEDSLHKVK